MVRKVSKTPQLKLDFLWVLIIHDLPILSHHREDTGKNKWKYKHGWSILCVVTYVVFTVTKHFRLEWCFCNNFALIQMQRTCIYSHVGNTSNQECILEKSETLSLIPSYFPTSSQATQTRRAPCVPHDLPVSQDWDPMLLSFSQSHPTSYRKHSGTIHPALTDLFLLGLLPESSV